MEGLLSFQFLTILLFFLLHLIPPLSSLENQLFSSCGKSFNCGNITGITYPFYGNDRPKECGYPGFELQCDEQGNTMLQITNVKYVVLDINMDAQIITVTRNDFVEWICDEFNKTTLNSNIFEYASRFVSVTFNYVCPPCAGSSPSAGPFNNCPIIKGMSYKNDFGGIETCNATIVVPVRNKELLSGRMIGDLRELKQLLEQGFDLRWKVNSMECKECEKFGGRCGFDVDAKKFSCLCADQSSSSSNPGTEHIQLVHLLTKM